MAGKFSMPRFEHEDLESTQELPQLPEDFEPMPQPVFQYEPQPQELEPYDPEEDLPEDFIDIALRVFQDCIAYCGKHWKKVLAVFCVLVLAIVIGAVAAVSAGNADPYDDKILNNVMIADVLVGGMTKEQAAATLNANLGNAYTRQTMTVDLGEQVIKLTPQETGAKLNVQAAIEAAYAYGRTGTDAEREQAYQASLSGNHILAVLPYLELNQEFIRSTFDSIEESVSSALTQPSYTLEGDDASLSTEDFNPAASGQTLVLTMGTPQVDFDAGAVFEQVIDAYSLGQFHVEAQGPVTTQQPENLDLDAIYEEFFLEPKAPTLDMTDFDTIPGSYGREFDLGEVKLLVAQAQPGEEIRIPMTYPAPEGDPASVLLRDVLGSYTTSRPDDANWTHNMKQACKAINGLKLNPGEIFSFNAVVGKRSESHGYQAAPSCDGADLAGTVGGGVCQVASTLYAAALLSDLEVVNRTAHSAPPAYIGQGLDAKVDWNGADMTFRNSSVYPICIEAEVSGSQLKVRIIGTDMRSYTTELESSITETVQPKIIYEEFPYDNDGSYEDGDVIQEGITGYRIKTYKRKYDKQTRELIAREFVATSTYPSQDKIVAQVAPPVIETEATDPPSETIPITLPTDPETGEVGDIEAVG